jgi:hypothetical protein
MNHSLFLAVIASSCPAMEINDPWILHKAVKKFDLEKVNELLAAKKVLVNATNRNLETALHVICSTECDAVVPEIGARRLEICKSLIAHGAEVNSVDRYGETPFFNIFCYGPKIINPRAPNGGHEETVLNCFLEQRKQIIALLVANHCNTKHINNTGLTAFYKACQKNDTFLKKLIDYAKECNLNGCEKIDDPKQPLLAAFQSDGNVCYEFCVIS